jgi:pimeloyl-ACP methyl ester carboxylesterase
VSTTSLTTRKTKPLPEVGATGSVDRGSSGEESQVAAPDGTRLYLRQKKGPGGVTALFCDGIACDGFIWKYLWDELAAHTSVAHFHYRGHGRSARPADPERVDVAAHAADADAVRHALGDPSVVLFGHSFGTQVALETYRLRPERIRALVFLCGSFGRVTYTFKNTDLLANVLPDLLAFVGKHPLVGRALWSNMPVKAALRVAELTGDVDLSRVKLEDVAPYFRHVSGLDLTMFLRMLRAAGEHSAEDLLPNVKVPVLVVAAERDSFTPPAVSRAMAEAIPGAELALLSAGSHLLPLERHEELKALVLDFLSRRVGVP